MFFLNTSVVLVEPKGAGNIGSVARIMDNFGFSDLRLVNPRVDHLSENARNMAVKSFPLLEQAGVFDNLAHCLADRNLVLGTTRRFGKYREEFFSPTESADFLASQSVKTRCALVFGSEDKGLRTSDLDLCQRLITIPTRGLPSLNLAQAVCICLYELSKKDSSGNSIPRKGLTPVRSRTLEDMYEHMEKTLLRIGFLDPQNPGHLMRAFRRMFGRALLNARDVRILRGLFSKIEWVDDERHRLQKEREGQ